MTSYFTIDNPVSEPDDVANLMMCVLYQINIRKPKKFYSELKSAMEVLKEDLFTEADEERKEKVDKLGELHKRLETLIEEIETI